jgi:D-alanine-D-alanine ligase
MRRKGTARCDVALLVDVETGEYRRSGRFVPDPGDVEEKILRALRRRYRRVEVVPFRPSLIDIVSQLRVLNPRIIFNLTEWVDGDRRHDAAIAGLLDIMKLRYTGTGPDGMRLARDKALSKHIVAGLGVPVARWFITGPGRAPRDRELPFPLIIKPLFGDGSEGINKRSLVSNARQMRARVSAIRGRLGEPAVCEEFIPGNDLYVGLLGNEPRVLPPIELVVRSRHRSAPRFATYRLKQDPRYRSKWRVHYRRARLGRAALRNLASASRQIFHALKLRDYARLDFRLRPDGRIYFIEANPNPDLDPHALNRSGCFSGVPYDTLLETIVESARRRGRR